MADCRVWQAKTVNSKRTELSVPKKKQGNPDSNLWNRAELVFKQDCQQI